jgi:oligopeptidase B
MNLKDTALLVRLSRFLVFLASWLRIAAAAILTLTAQWNARADGPEGGPRARQVPHEVSTVFGAKRSDPYFWLRDDTRSDSQVLNYLKAENAYTDQVLEPSKGLRNAIRDEIERLVPPTDSSVPYLERGYWYYVCFEQGQNYPVIARKKEHGDGSEQVLLDEPRRAPANGYFSVGNWTVSPDGHLLAWTEDRVGRLQYELHVKNLKTGRVLEDTVRGLSANILWGGDSKTILYVVNNKELRPQWLKSHVLGTPAFQDRTLYDESDNTFYSMLVRTNDLKFVCLEGFSMVASEWRCARESAPTDFKVIEPREVGHLYDVDHANGSWYVRTNWNAPNYRIMSVADVALPRRRGAWREVVATKADASIDALKAFDGYLAFDERFEANTHVVIRVADGKTREVPAEEPAYSMSLSRDQNSSGRWVRYDYESLASPTVTREINVDSGLLRTLKSKTLPGYDRSQYAVERVWVKARDGERIPVSLLHRKDWKKDGRGGLLQYAYGAYSVSVDVRFMDYAVSLVDRGVVFAIAHVRGGQDMGRSWYDQGHLFHKMNTFTDYIDVTRGLVAQGFAAKDRVIALGGSAGGTLMGAVANMAPDAYRVILAIVPYVDAVTTMLDPSIPLVTREYDEWGDPNRRKDYEYMLTWSPYDNVGAHAYPAMYVYTGLWDSQVQYYEPTKWVAKLRAIKTDANPLVLRINMEGGHGGPAGRFQQAEARSEYLAFGLWRLGLRE